jgi:hypothetical protein
MKYETIKVWLDGDTTIVSGTNKEILMNLILRSNYNVVDVIESLDSDYWNVELFKTEENEIRK